MAMMRLYRALVVLLSLGMFGLLGNACVGSEKESALSKSEQKVIAVSPPNNPSSTFYLDHPALLFEEIDIWCGNNQSGRRPELGGENNVCAQMCDTRIGFITSTANLATSLFADVVAVGGSVSSQVVANLMACGVDAWAIQQLVDDPWCAQNPAQCGISIGANVGCCALEFVSAINVINTNPYYAGLSAACAAGPMLGSWIEMNGLLNLCRAHILNEISMPINHQQGCFCQRQEIRSNWGVYHPCGAATQWAQVGTAQANCTNHDSDWLPVASAACQGDGASNGSTFYRYTNCQWTTNTQPNWCAFQNAFVGTATDIATPVENACICNQEEQTRTWAGGTHWACSPPSQVVMGTNQGINQCAGNNGDTGWLGTPGAACAAAGRPAGSTWHHRWNCHLITPSSAMWGVMGLPPPTTPPQVTLAPGPGCPGPGSGSGSGAGGDAGVGSGSDAGMGSGSDAGMGSGSDAGMGSGSGTDAGTGSGSGYP